MAWQKGPGEGYHAAKDDALAINPKLKCVRVCHRDGSQAGFVIEDERGRNLGTGLQARDAWNAAFFKLGGAFENGRAILPRGETAPVKEG